MNNDIDNCAGANYDVLIIGNGLAALATALSLPTDLQVAILCKSTLRDNASCLAQGGIAAATSMPESIESHVQDTLLAGAGLCDESAVRLILSKGQDAINWLMSHAVTFDQEANGRMHLTQEGGHCKRRIYHCADHTGQTIMQALLTKIDQSPHITVIEQCFVLSLCIDNGQCMGVECRINHQNHTFFASYTVLATGGAGQVYHHTTSPAVCTGDGFAMAYWAGCRLANCEFVQFHPTGLAMPTQQERTFLISEALRGEGAVLIDADGCRFMPSYDHRAELAPRDIVARSIAYHQMSTGKHIYLDIRHRSQKFIHSHFSTIATMCQNQGIDICTMPIPVTPVQHYFCGGVLTDTKGCTDIMHLYAVGEVACTGLHGANRLASNSLLECVVIAQRIADDILDRYIQHKPWQKIQALESWHIVQRNPNCPSFLQSKKTSKATLTKSMVKHEVQSALGIVRYPEQIRTLIDRLTPWMIRRPDFSCTNISNIELYNLITCAYLLATSALARHDSVGSHYWGNKQH